ncbi:hypothetical protein FRC03_006235 [Tulasnella sp. 419]|nr:hypothetical protein FRC03_006235 [Tulasnella sp. 419]
MEHRVSRHTEDVRYVIKSSASMVCLLLRPKLSLAQFNPIIGTIATPQFRL